MKRWIPMVAIAGFLVAAVSAIAVMSINGNTLTRTAQADTAQVQDQDAKKDCGTCKADKKASSDCSSCPVGQMDKAGCCASNAKSSACATEDKAGCCPSKAQAKNSSCASMCKTPCCAGCECGGETAGVGQAAPDFVVIGTDGEMHRLADMRGKVVVLHFQSMNCPWDKIETGAQPHLNKMAQAYADRDTPVVFIGINANKAESLSELQAYQQRADVPYTLAKDPGNRVADLYGAKTTPHMYVIDTEGVLRYAGGLETPPPSPSRVGQMDEQYLKPVLDALLAGQELPYTQTMSKGCSIKRLN